jgi:hypothetical protein
MPRVQFYTPIRVATFILLLAVGLALVQVPVNSAQKFPREGQLASEAVIATADLDFESALLTQQARDEAAAEVPVQLTFDAGIRTAQVAVLANNLDEVDRVRADILATDEERADALAAIPDQNASPRSQVLILGFTDREWDRVRERSIELLTELLTDSLTEEDLAGVRADLASDVGFGFTTPQREVIEELVGALIVSNVLENVDATEGERAEARASVQPISRTFTKGELIVSADQEVDALIGEALAQLEPEGGGVPGDDLIALLILSFAAAVTLGVYLVVATPNAASSDRRLLLLGVLTIGAVAVARFVIPLVLPEQEEKALELMLPIATSAVLVSVLLERTLAVIVATIVAVLAGTAAIVQPDFGPGEAPAGAQALRPLAVYLFASIAGIYASYRVERLTQYGITGAAVGGAVIVIGVAFWLLNPERSTSELLWTLLAGLVSGVATAVLTIGAFSFLGLAFGITTRLQLLELAQLTQPLLRRLQEEAPGTFHHAQLVATMAERAASEIEADALLVRVGAYYHDIGKLAKPHMYIENQSDGSNPHDSLDPLESANVIQDHVRWGAELASRHRLPKQVQAFIPEHHGTRMVTYFYRKAARTDPGVDPALFTYAGPRPQTRETAIVMMADSCEAVVRSSRQRDIETIEKLVDGVINERLAERQFDDTDLTFRQLARIAQSFKITLRGVYHPRIEYPQPTAAEQRAAGGHAARLPTSVGAPPAPTTDSPVDGGALPEEGRGAD